MHPPIEEVPHARRPARRPNASRRVRDSNLPSAPLPQPGETRATATVGRLIDKYGPEHTRLVLCILAEGRGNSALIDETTLWAISDIVLACEDLVEENASQLLQMFDRIPLGPFLAIVNELRGIVPQRPALAGILYFTLSRMSEEPLTGHAARYGVAKAASRSEIEKGRAAIRRYNRTRDEKVALGRELLAKRGKVRQGEWGVYLREAGMNASTACNYMRMALEAEEAAGRLEKAA